MIRLFSTLLLTGVMAPLAHANDRLTELQRDPRQWVMPARDYASTRFSPLGEINRANVENLRVAWTFSTGELKGHEGSPLVVGNTMYLSTPFPNRVYALDLGQPGIPLKWQYTPKQDQTTTLVACCDAVNRGLAYASEGNGMLFLNTLDASTVALDANTGKQLWRVYQGNYKNGETMTLAPLVVGDVVISGISGGELGVRGFATANRIKTGERVWRAFSTGRDSDVLIDYSYFAAPYPDHNGVDLGVRTWVADQWKRGGGTVWGWLSYDPKIKLLYYGTSNAGVWNADQRPGDNKWSATIFARNPSNGLAKWAYQMSPHEAGDYDGVNESILADLEVNGKTVRALIHFDRNGFAYTIDRMTGKVLVAEAFVPTNWARGIDLASGRPLREESNQIRQDRRTSNICPAAIGGKDQQPAAYSPLTRLAYVPTQNICMDAQGVQVKHEPGRPYLGAIVEMYAGLGGNRGAFIAWDPTKGRKVWEIKEPFGVYSGALATAGGLVFYGTLDGWFKAVDAETGAELWKFKAPSGIVGNPISYEAPDGRQYVAVLTGVGGWAGLPLSAQFDPEAVTGGLGVGGAYSELRNVTRLGGVLMAFSLP